MDGIWDAIEFFEELGKIRQIVWWYDWGIFVALFLVLGALLWIFYETRNQRVTVGRKLTQSQIIIIVALVLLLPSLLARLFPLAFLNLLGFEQEVDLGELYSRLIEIITGEWDPVEDLRQIKTVLTTMAISGWLGVVFGGAAVVLHRGPGQIIGLGQQIRCQNCGRVLDITWDYCPYCTPPRQESYPPIDIPKTVGDPFLPPTAQEQPQQVIPAFQQPGQQAVPPIEPTIPLDQPAPATAWLVVRTGAYAGQQFGLNRPNITIGRDPGNDIALGDPMISTRHARIRQAEGRFVLHDTASMNGTFVNDQRTQRKLLIDGDRIRLGSVEMVFREVR